MNISQLVTFVGYKITDEQFSSDQNSIKIYLEKETHQPKCCRCDSEMRIRRGSHQMKIRHLPIFEKPCYLIFRRDKFHCDICKKARSEKVNFLANESPHLTKDFVFWLAKFVEISTVKEAAEFSDLDDSTMWRIDFARLRRLFLSYKIPLPRKICVDEVCAHGKKDGESNNERFFTVITDAIKKKVIWVSKSRDRKALDEFFELIGKEGRNKITLIATDQHPGYTASIKEHCPNAKHVFDKFHLMRKFEDAIDSTRKMIVKMMFKDNKIRDLVSGRKKFIFMKKASKRSDSEKKLMSEVMEENKSFYRLELIKERMITFFYPTNTVVQAKEILLEIKDWIWEAGFSPLKKWFKNFAKDWSRIYYYFIDPITTALSEGINNVIKMIKRRSFGYRNSEYFKLKILQKSGYLHSRYESRS